MTQLFRSLIFVPGNNPRFLEKAKKLQADVVCFDLEDSVPDNEKISARKLIKNALKSRSEYSSSIFVRTNSPLSGKIPSDLKEIVQKGIDGIVIPKVNNVSELKKIQKILSGLGLCQYKPLFYLFDGPQSQALFVHVLQGSWHQ